MKKRVLSLLGATLLSGSLLSADVFANMPYDKDIQEMQRLFNSMVDAHFSHARLANLGYPRVDVREDKSSYTYEFDVAGVPKENIKLSIDENNFLTLEGKKENTRENKSKNYVSQEIFYGSFHRVIKLPENANQDKVTTEYKDGILKLTIAKKELKKPKSKILPIN